MPMTKLCPIADFRQLTEDVFSLTLEVGDMARDARPGQFVNIRCGEGLLLRRPISVCDVVGTLLTVVFQVKGEGTQWLSRRQAGEKLDVLGPLGHGYDIPRGKVLVAGGGIGVPPMLYAAKCCREADACVGFRSADNAILLEELNAACGKVMVASDDGTLGVHGFVDALVRQALSEDSYAAVFACGPRPMLKSVAGVAREGNVPCFVSMEERMGCGVGACLVCACSVGGYYRHVCKDGPVFNAEEVDW
ncbi:MAG: dihydroorotate dehydrogenase electron transfer subunit [Clostridiales bacterium]|nr:dihydroorotate dehydrogenase electron transfer subunit [Clostridiales bacterium]